MKKIANKKYPSTQIVCAQKYLFRVNLFTSLSSLSSVMLPASTNHFARSVLRRLWMKRSPHATIREYLAPLIRVGKYLKSVKSRTVNELLDELLTQPNGSELPLAIWGCDVDALVLNAASIRS